MNYLIIVQQVTDSATVLKTLSTVVDSMEAAQAVVEARNALSGDVSAAPMVETLYGIVEVTITLAE